MAGFLQRIREEIDRGVVQVGTRSRGLVETTQIRSQIRLLQSRKQQGTAELGEVVFKMLRQGPFDQARVEPYVTLLHQLDEQIVALEDKIREAREAAEAALRATRTPAFAHCSCGEALREESRFCPRCGQDVTVIVEAARNPPIHGRQSCPSCGAAAAEAARFCGACGTSLRAGQ